MKGFEVCVYFRKQNHGQYCLDRQALAGTQMYRNLEFVRDWLPEFQQNKNCQFGQLLQADCGCDDQREGVGYGFKEWNLSVTQALF